MQIKINASIHEVHTVLGHNTYRCVLGSFSLMCLAELSIFMLRKPSALSAVAPCPQRGCPMVYFTSLAWIGFHLLVFETGPP